MKGEVDYQLVCEFYSRLDQVENSLKESTQNSSPETEFKNDLLIWRNFVDKKLPENILALRRFVDFQWLNSMKGFADSYPLALSLMSQIGQVTIFDSTQLGDDSRPLTVSERGKLSISQGFNLLEESDTWNDIAKTYHKRAKRRLSDVLKITPFDPCVDPQIDRLVFQTESNIAGVEIKVEFDKIIGLDRFTMCLTPEILSSLIYHPHRNFKLNHEGT